MRRKRESPPKGEVKRHGQSLESEKRMVCGNGLFTAPCISAEGDYLKIFYCSGSQLEIILTPGKHLVMSGDIYSYLN